MKRLMTIFAGILCSCMVLEAQQYDVLDIVKADVRKSYGMEGPHRLDEFGTLSKAPAGPYACPGCLLPLERFPRFCRPDYERTS